MKRFLSMIALGACMAIAAFSHTPQSSTATNAPQVSATNGCCHVWQAGRPGESEHVSFADYHPGVVYRHCCRCKLVESKSAEQVRREWK